VTGSWKQKSPNLPSFQCTYNNLKNKAKNQSNLKQDPNSSKKKNVQKSRPNKVGEKSIYLQVALGQRATHAYRMQTIFQSSMAQL
jgi:hypothetical protein